MKTDITKILIVLLGILPFYFFNIYDKLYGAIEYSVVNLLTIPVILAIVGMIVLYLLSRVLKNKTILKTGFEKERLFGDMLIAFLLLIVIFILEPVSAITFKVWIVEDQTDRSAITQSLIDILSNPLSAIWFMAVVVVSGQIFIEYIRIFLLKYSAAFSNSRFGRTIVIFNVALFLSLLHIDNGISGIIFEFLIAILFNYTYLKTGRVLPLIYAGSIYQFIALINFGMRFCWN